MRLALILAVFVAFIVVTGEFGQSAEAIDFTSCARMNNGALGAKVARGACISSCKFQNCGTGHCEMRNGRPVCVCSRCGNGGGEWPNLPSKG